MQCSNMRKRNRGGFPVCPETETAVTFVLLQGGAPFSHIDDLIKHNKHKKNVIQNH